MEQTTTLTYSERQLADAALRFFRVHRIEEPGNRFSRAEIDALLIKIAKGA